jgi:hypothetical protein
VFAVLRVIKHLLFCKARGTLIVPKLVSAPYWPYIFDENLCYRTYISDVLEFKNAIMTMQKRIAQHYHQGKQIITLRISAKTRQNKFQN